jgi:hypothetical protein
MFKLERTDVMVLRTDGRKTCRFGAILLVGLVMVMEEGRHWVCSIG